MKKILRNIFLLEFLFSKDKKELPTVITTTTTEAPKQLTVEEEAAKAAEELKVWLEDPTNKARIVETAKIFDLIMKNKWFDLKDVMNKTNYKTISSALNILNTLKLAQCLVAEERGGREVFKITLTGKNRIKLLEIMLKRKQREVKEIQDELEKSGSISKE